MNQPEIPAVPSHRRIIVCGGRGFSDRGAVESLLATFDPKYDTIVHGGATGADLLAGRVARGMGFRVEEWLAHWTAPCSPECAHGPRKTWPNGQSYCPAAGLHRNQRMLDLGADLVVGFPGARGTTHMLQIAQDAGVPWMSPGWGPKVVVR